MLNNRISTSGLPTILFFFSNIFLDVLGMSSILLPRKGLQPWACNMKNISPT